MSAVDLTDQEWGQLMFVLANAEGKGITWSMVNPLMMKIGDQLRVQANAKRYTPPTEKADGEDMEVRQ